MPGSASGGCLLEFVIEASKRSDRYEAKVWSTPVSKDFQGTILRNSAQINYERPMTRTMKSRQNLNAQVRQTLERRSDSRLILDYIKPRGIPIRPNAGASVSTTGTWGPFRSVADARVTNLSPKLYPSHPSLTNWILLDNTEILQGVTRANGCEFEGFQCLPSFGFQSAPPAMPIIPCPPPCTITVPRPLEQG